MVSSATIKKFAEQIDALESKFKAKRGQKVVFVTCAYGEASDDAWERHLIEHPDDADADIVITNLFEERVPGDYERAKKLAASKAEQLRAVGQGRNIALVPHKASSTEQWAADWARAGKDD